MQTTARTIEYPFTEGHLLPVSTFAARLRRVSWIYFDEGSTSRVPLGHRFVEQHRKESRPGRVTNAFGKAMIVLHPINVQILNCNHAIAVNYFSGMLVAKVIPFEANSLMHPGYRFTSEPCSGYFDYPSSELVKKASSSWNIEWPGYFESSSGEI